MDLTTRALSGLALMILGTLALVAVAAGMISGLDIVLLIGAVLLTVGTYLVGTDVPGTPV